MNRGQNQMYGRNSGMGAMNQIGLGSMSTGNMDMTMGQDNMPQTVPPEVVVEILFENMDGELVEIDTGMRMTGVHPDINQHRIFPL